MSELLLNEEATRMLKGIGKADPEAIANRVLAVSAAHSGRLKPKHIVEDAANPESALHPLFEWDDAKAAHGYRLEQARSLIRAVQIVGPDNGAPERAFLSVSAGDGRFYREVKTIRQSLDLQLALLRDARREAAAFGKRFSSIETVCEFAAKAVKDLDEQIAAQEKAAKASA